jgi:antirestriction protein ArdC
MDVYANVTSRIMELLEGGEIPWRKPWKASGSAKNFISKKPYRGINQFLLNCSPYASPYWLTFKQATEKGGCVRKGEKSTLVVFWKWIEPETDDQVEFLQTLLTGKVPLLRYYNVFNLEQVDGIEPPQEEQIPNPFSPIEQAQLIIAEMPNKPGIECGGDRAFYSPALDKVTLPNREAFSSPETFYSTVFHELTHATGHPSRLCRKGITDPTYFGSHDYSQEELVAEFGASMLCAVAEIGQQTIENSAAYIQGWLKVLKGDKKLAIIAAGQAQRAADFILNKQEAEEQG